MRPRFLVAVGADPLRQAALAARAAARGLAARVDRPGLLIVVSGEPALAVDDGGLVVGTVFRPGVAGPLAAFGAAGAAAVAATAGQYLFDYCWGDYVAILPTADGVRVLRAPFGGLPCLLCRVDGIELAASDVDLLETVGGYRRAIDAVALVRHLAAGDIRRSETCLAGVSEVRGGDRATLTGTGTTRDTGWAPWRFAGERGQLHDRVEADRRLFQQTLYCVRERSAGLIRPLLLLSGGLDSSIVAAALAATNRAFACLTFATENPTGDERSFARLVADALGRPLEEDRNRIELIDLTWSAAAGLPRPVARGFEQGIARRGDAVADLLGCDAIFDGGGGDNVFGSLQSATPAADCLLCEAGRPQFRRVVADIAELAQASRWRVAWRARRRARRRTGYRWPIDTRFLSPAAAALAQTDSLHPWLAAPGDILPGRAAHVAMLIAAQGLAEDGLVTGALPVAAPLVSQPLIETCLRIPSWEWFEQGSNRAAARRAFAHLLPSAIAWRRSKGTPDSFVLELFDANRLLLRDWLGGGWLAERGLIDVAAVTAALDDPAPVRDHGFVRLMQLMDAEAWARAQTAAQGLPASGASCPARKAAQRSYCERLAGSGSRRSCSQNENQSRLRS